MCTVSKRSIDDTLLELIIGITAFGAICQILGIWLVSDKAGYSLGLWLGVISGIFMAAHMWWSLNSALDEPEARAQKLIRSHSMLRYGVVVLVFVGLAITKIANPLAAFLGIMGLKVAAYLQPFTHKVRKKFHNIFH